MNDVILLSDDLLDRLADFYSSEFVAMNMPWLRQVTFAEFVEREIRSRASAIKL